MSQITEIARKIACQAGKPGYIWNYSNLPIGPNKEGTMAWNTPKIVEISVGLEINSYVCAEL